MAKVPPMPDTRTSVNVAVNGAAIRKRRVEELGENLRTFAARVPISLTYLSDIELGRRARVSPRVFADLRAALDLPADRAHEIKVSA